jgi:four helix bundle protein
MGSKTFKDLKVWQLAHEINLAVDALAENFPRRDLYVMTDQMRRAAYSVPTNITEGFGRRGTRDKAHFYNISAGSAEELKYHLLCARDRGLLPRFQELWDKSESVTRMLRALIDKILTEGSTAR